MRNPLIVCERYEYYKKRYGHEFTMVYSLLNVKKAQWYAF
jgi:hypothetical protein